MSSHMTGTIIGGRGDKFPICGTTYDVGFNMAKKMKIDGVFDA